LVPTLDNLLYIWHAQQWANPREMLDFAGPLQYCICARYHCTGVSEIKALPFAMPEWNIYILSQGKMIRFYTQKHHLINLSFILLLLLTVFFFLLFIFTFCCIVCVWLRCYAPNLNKRVYFCEYRQGRITVTVMQCCMVSTFFTILVLINILI